MPYSLRSDKRREARWIASAIAYAIAFCVISRQEYGYRPVLFFLLCFYVLSWVARFVFVLLWR